MELPTETREWLGENLVSLSGIARDKNVERATVSNWVARYPDVFEPLVIARVPGPLFLRPEVERALAELRLPDKRYTGKRGTRGAA